MKSITKVSRLLFLLIALFTIVTICNFDSVEAKTNEKLIYQKFLRREYKKPYSGDGGKRGFYLINLDGKGVRELVLTRGKVGGWGNSSFYVYTIKKGKVKRIGSFLHRSGCACFEYNKKLKTIKGETILINNAHGYLDSIRYRCKNNRLKEEFICLEWRHIINANKHGYGGKTVSKAKYNKYHKKHYSSIKWKKYYMKELTPRNINAL